MNQEVILQVNNLVTAFDTETGRIRAVDDVSFQVKNGRTFALAGGITMTAGIGYTLRASPTDGESEDQEQVSSGSIAGTFTNGGSEFTDFSTCAVAFQAG